MKGLDILSRLIGEAIFNIYRRGSKYIGIPGEKISRLSLEERTELGKLSSDDIGKLHSMYGYEFDDRDSRKRIEAQNLKLEFDNNIK